MADDAFPRPVLLSVDEFERAFEAGVFAMRRVELREGVVVEMSPVHAPHAVTRDDLLVLLRAAIRGHGLPLRVASEISPRFQRSVPTADILIWEGPLPRKTVPGAQVRLAVEVADSTLTDDLGAKRALYAAAGCPEYWVIDINARRALQFAEPRDGAYAREAETPYGGRLAALTIPGLALDLVGLPELDDHG